MIFYDVIDLCCGAGGATKGYQRLGLTVGGVDKFSQPEYCGDMFWQMDAVTWMTKVYPTLERKPRLIHWSPPCQYDNPLTVGTNAELGLRDNHVDLIPVLRPLIEATALPHVLEQPAGRSKNKMRRDVMLCMDMFKTEIGQPPWVQRHRYFEVNGFGVEEVPYHDGTHGGMYVRGWRHGVYRDGPYIAAYGKGGGKGNVWEMQHAMGMEWVEDHVALTEAIPPAFTEWIGRQFLNNMNKA